MAQSSLVYQASVGVSYWPFTSRCKGCVARVYLFAPHDRPSPLFPQAQPSRSLKCGISPGSPVVVSVLGLLEWLFLGMVAAPDWVVTSDASGSLGFGAYFRGEWFSGSWTPSQASQSIAYKELFPVVIAAHLWGPQWARRYVLFRSDNEAVVYILNSRTSKIPDLMRLLCHLLASATHLIFFFCS